MLFLDVFGDSSGWDPHRDDNNCEDDIIEGEMFKQLGVKEEDKDADDEVLKVTRSITSLHISCYFQTIFILCSYDVHMTSMKSILYKSFLLLF